MPKKIIIEKLYKIAKKNGGQCLSKKYINNRQKITWQCQKKHIWTASYIMLKKGRWCPICKKFMNNLDNINLLKKIAKQNGGKLLSDNYIDNQTNLLWECEFGHTWIATPSNIKNYNTWCMKCSGKQKLTIEQMKDIAKNMGGECLSNEYVNVQTKLIWKCKDGHIWKSRPNLIKNKQTWCPQCSSSLGEKACKILLENFLHYKFKKIRPSWLKNKNKNNLELDGYCEELGIAFEYNGTQHYIKSFRSETDAKLKKIKEHDIIKYNECKNLNITLLRIKEQIPFNLQNIIEEIKNILTINKIQFTSNINIEEIKNNVYNNTKIEKYIDIAKSRGGKCISIKYINAMTKLTWECINKHIWQATPNNIQQGGWCPQCWRLKK